LKNIIGQQMIIGIEGTELSKEDAQFIVENNIGGVILFTRNYESIEQLHQLISDIQRLRYKTEEKTPLFISADMEGGRVQRFKEPFTIWPPFQKLGDLDSASKSFDYTFMQGSELKSLGINMNYSPCLDVLFNPENEVIGDRAISESPQLVARHASALVRGFLKAGVLPVAKHFPGHGFTKVDSHFDLPVDERNLMEIQSNGDLEPFQSVFKARVPFIMTAHILYPAIDKDFPVTLSKIFLKTILRDSLRYRGIVMTDDLDMKALSDRYSTEELPSMAINAGANVLLYCNEPKSPRLAVEALLQDVAKSKVSKEDLQNNYEMVIDLKKKQLVQPIEPFSIEKVQSIVGHPDHHEFAKRLNEGTLLEES